MPETDPTISLSTQTPAQGWSESNASAAVVAPNPDGVYLPAVSQSSDLFNPLGSGAKKIAAGAMNLTATFSSVGIELFYSGDANQNATATVQFKKATDPTWRAGLPLWETAGSSPTAFYGSLLQLASGTSYTVQITLSDPDGVVGPTVVQGTIATKVDAIVPATALAPTYFVATAGSDANNGTSAQTAWATVGKALTSAPSGAVVQIGPGNYTVNDNWVGAGITLVAQYPAVDDTRTAINSGLHSILENDDVARPNTNAWQQVALVGPNSGQTFSVWKRTTTIPLSSISAPSSCGYAPDLPTLPTRIPIWAGVPNNETPAHWAEKLFMNTTFNYGCWADPAHPDDVYMRVWGDANPNNSVTTISGGRILEVAASTVRLSGLEFRGAVTDVWVHPNETNVVVDHNLFTGFSKGIFFDSDAKNPSTGYSSDNVVQYNLFQDSSAWVVNGSPAESWDWLKGSIGSPVWQGQPTNWYAADVHDGQPDENNPLYGHGSKRLTVRYNTFSQFWDSLSTYCSTCDRYTFQDLDFHDNLLQYNPDDAIEITGISAINWRIWNNTFQYTGTVFSVSSPGTNYGPIYVFRNTAWRVGTAGCGKPCNGMDGTFFKYSNQDTIPARIYVINNTFWTDDPAIGTDGQSHGTDGSCFCSTGNQLAEAFYLRNNIVATTRKVFQVIQTPHYDEDYNWFSTTDSGADGGLQWVNNVHYGSPAAYTSVSRLGAHDDFVGGVPLPTYASQPPSLTNPTQGDLTLATGSPEIDAGTLVPNIADLPGVNYLGNAPDLGATEKQ